MLTGIILVDGFSHLRFIRLVSQLYQGLGPIDPPPCYEMEAIEFTGPLEASPPSHPHHDPSTPPPWEQREGEPIEFVGIRLTAAQLAEIHGFVTKGRRHLRIPRVDIVVGLLARCLSEIEPESKPIDTISYVVNVRTFAFLSPAQLTLLQHRGMGIYPQSAALNGIIWLPTAAGPQIPEGLDPREGVLAWVTEIRKSLARLKDPGFLRGMVTDLAKRLSHTAWAKSGLSDMLIVKEGLLTVNNTWK